MYLHLQRQIDKLKQMILQLGTRVEEITHGAIQAVHNRDAQLAKQIIESDKAIDLMEVDIEEECLKTLALYQPVAFDLRYVVAILKINNDLERIADQAVNVATQATMLADAEKIGGVPQELTEMAGIAQSMLKKSLDALVALDTELAQQVRATDDEVDDIHRHIYEIVEQRIIKHPEHVHQMVCLAGISRQLERIADHAVNIAEDVLYLAKGDIHRHTHLTSAREEAQSADS